MKPYHIQTEAQYVSFKAAAAVFNILGLNADNCADYGFVIPTDEPRPETTAAQKATKADKPTENPDGSWSYKWTVTDKTAEELADELPQAREQAKAAMLAWINDFLRPFTAAAAEAEPLAWAAKELAARAYPNGTPEQTAMIEVEASVTGETPAQLCAIIIGQADLYRQIIAFTTGLRRKTVAEIDAADLAAIPAVLDAAKAAAIAKAQELGVA